MPNTELNPRQHIAVVAVFDPQGEVLLLKQPEDKHQGGLWTFPGGKVEEGESPLEAAQRELVEETGIAGVAWEAVGTCDYTYPDRWLCFHLFCCRCHDPAALNCLEPHLWVPVGRLTEYPMPQANIDLLNPMLLAHLHAA